MARKGLKRAVDDLLHPPSARLVGKAPTADGGEPLSSRDAWGHDHLWWLDRMVRSNQPLVERMTLIWHDWFATSNAGVGSQKWMLTQNSLFRKHALGNFESLLIAVTHDPAMLIWLNRRRQQEVEPERELRARADGDLHPGRRRRVYGGSASASRPGRSPAGETTGRTASGTSTSATTPRDTTTG